MKPYQLCEVTCRGCEDIFYVHPEQNAFAPDADLCHKCRCFKSAMEHMMNPPESWEKPHSSSLLRGFAWGFLIVSPFWLIGFYFFCVR